MTGQFSAVDDLLTGEENLRLMAALHHLGSEEGRRRIADLLERFELTDAAAKHVATYSGGMKRRLDLAMTLMGNPRIVFLDEPTSGVDPRGRRTMWQIVGDLVADGITIFLTTQYLEEADELANRIALLDHGRIVAEGTPAQLKRLVPGGAVRLEFTEPRRSSAPPAGYAGAARSRWPRPPRPDRWRRCGAARPSWTSWTGPRPTSPTSASRPLISTTSSCP